MSLHHVETAQTSTPAAASGVTITPGNAFANGAYVQMIASLAAAAMLSSVHYTSGNASDVEWDVSTGAGGSEVVQSTFAWECTSAADEPNWMLNVPLPIDKFTNASRVACRARVASGTAASGITLTFLLKPVTGTFRSTTNATTLLPSASAATSTSTSTTTAWVNGAYVAITASTANAIVVGWWSAVSNGSVEWEADLATGAGGSEVVVYTIRDEAINTITNGQKGGHLLQPLLDNIATSTRVAVRARCSATNVHTVTHKLVVFNQSGF